MVTFINKNTRAKYAGDVLDNAPKKVRNGSVYFAMAEGKYYMYDAENDIWYEQKDNGSGGGSGGTVDHTKLTNRDKADQHPIEAITGLREELDDKASVEDALPPIGPDDEGKVLAAAGKDAKWEKKTASVETAGFVKAGDCMMMVGEAITISDKIVESNLVNVFKVDENDIIPGGLYLASTGQWYANPGWWSTGLITAASEIFNQGGIGVNRIRVLSPYIDSGGVQVTMWISRPKEDEQIGDFRGGFVIPGVDGVCDFTWGTGGGDKFQDLRIGFRTSVPPESVTIILGDDTDAKVFRLKLDVPEAQIIHGGKQWAGKKCVAFGTSITATNNTLDNGKPTGKYIPYLAKLSGLKITNHGVAGGSINGHILYYLRYYKDDMADADLVTIEGAVNDYAAAVPLGKVGDTTPHTHDLLPDGSPEGTFAGACYQAFKAAIENAPKATVVLITEPTGRYIKSTGAHYDLAARNSLGLSQQDYIQMTVDVARYVGVNVILAGQNSSINEFNPQYYSDHIHHNELGGKQYAATIWADLRNIQGKEV